MRNLTQEQNSLIATKNRLFCLTEDAKKFGGYVTVLTRFRGNWNGKTYKSRFLLDAHKGGY
jgi:hypothetical protein